MSFKIGNVYGQLARKMLQTHYPDDDLFWKLSIANLVVSPRCNIPLKNGLDLYVYDQLLPGMSTWKDYYIFMEKLIQEYEM